MEHWGLELSFKQITKLLGFTLPVTKNLFRETVHEPPMYYEEGGMNTFYSLNQAKLPSWGPRAKFSSRSYYWALYFYWARVGEGEGEGDGRQTDGGMQRVHTRLCRYMCVGLLWIWFSGSLLKYATRHLEPNLWPTSNTHCHGTRSLHFIPLASACFTFHFSWCLHLGKNKTKTKTNKPLKFQTVNWQKSFSKWGLIDA